MRASVLALSHFGQKRHHSSKTIFKYFTKSFFQDTNDKERKDDTDLPKL